MKKTLVTIGLVVLFSTAATAETLVIAGGTIHSMAGEPAIGNVVVEDGVIVSVGDDAGPDGATPIDATGLHVYPGFFDALGQMGLVEVGAVAATVDTTELGNYNPHLLAATAVHPASELIAVGRSNGITQVITAPRTGRDGVIAGQASLIHMTGWTIEEMAIDPAIAMVIAWPAIQTRTFDFRTFSVRETPFKEAKENAEKARDELRDWMDAARHYAQAAGGGRAERDLKLEALASVLDGKKRVVVMANAKRDIEAVVEFAEEEGLQIILAGGRDAWKVKELLAEKGIPVILGLTQSLPAQEDDSYDRPFKTAAELVAAGVEISFATGAGGGRGPGGPHAVRILPYEASMASAYGLPREEALKALTINPARIFGVDDKLGTVEEGKMANLVVTDGDPLEITTQVRYLLIKGSSVSLANKHQDLYELHRSRPSP